MRRNNKSPRQMPVFVCRWAIILMLACAGILRNHGLLAIENPPAASPDQKEYGQQKSSVSFTPVARNFPLSTWVGPGDALRIRSYPDTASFVSGYYTIMDSGFVTLPMIGSIKVTETSIAELTRHLNDYYAKYVAYTSLQIEPQIRIYFLGGFLRPGAYLVSPFQTFSNAISLAGGTVRDDGLHLLKWERNGKEMAKDLTAAVESPQSLYVMGFKSNDQVCVTVRGKREISPLTAYLTSSLISLGTLAVTLLIFLDQNK
jgi:protein involved in polysaccharide export with SLBB domain